MGEETVFDKILAKKIPCDPLYEDDWVLAFRDMNPQAPCHVLVIPKRKIKSFSEISSQNAQDIGEFMIRISKVASQLNLDEAGYRIVFNTGKNGQQTVNYIHAHILGERQMKWPPG